MANNLRNINPTVSTMFGPKSSNTSPYMNLPVTASLINYLPVSQKGSADDSLADDCIKPKPVLEEEEDSTEEDSSLGQAVSEYGDRGLTVCRDLEGNWICYRFTLNEWQLAKPKAYSKSDIAEDETALDGFDGILTKKIMIPNLCRIDRCPVLHRYAYTKCVLTKKNLIDIELIKQYRYLQYLDVSGNKLATLKALGNLPFLKILDASHNLLTTVLDFKAPFYLTVVNLSYNKIKIMRDIRDFWSITDLNLAHNMIKTIDGIKELRYLTTLNISSNRIATIENLDGMKVQFLHLQSNLIKLNEDDQKAKLFTLRNIRTINLTHNMISSLKAFESVENLECLDIADNNVSTLLDIYYLRNLIYLNKLNLMENPVTYIDRYSEMCVTYIKNLVMLDCELLSRDLWLKKLNNANDISLVAAHSRLKLLVLEQLNPPQIWDWLLPYDNPPLAVIVLVGLQASHLPYIAKRFCQDCERVVVGIPYTTKPKPEDEEDGDYFYYVDNDTFLTMLKKGEFLTYEQHFGFYDGIAHSAFKKAQNGIIMFYTHLTMALAIKRKLLNAVLVLSLPSTEQVHLEKLKALIAVEFIDKDTMRIFNNSVGLDGPQTYFADDVDEPLVREAYSIVEKMVSDVCEMFEQDCRVTESNTPCVAKKAMSDGCQENEMFQIWRTSAPSLGMSQVIRPSDVDSGESKDSYLKDLNKTDFDSDPSESNRYVSFTVAHVHKIFDSRVDASKMPDKRGKSSKSHTLTTFVDVSGKGPDDITDKVELKASTTSSLPDSKDRQPTATYSLPIKGPFDAKIKTLFEEEQRQREELLELHMQEPGFFREMIFTDREKESIDKLNALVNDIENFNQNTKKAILNFENDAAFVELHKRKISACFKELKKEVSVSQKQAEEFAAKIPKKICPVTCENPDCPIWEDN